ncbi:MAG TPA: c-type cytochrome [Bacillus bacterium]|nr:c-type cytochrome [Bacillus sp. (in: firmicutes)]
MSRKGWLGSLFAALLIVVTACNGTTEQVVKSPDKEIASEEVVKELVMNPPKMADLEGKDDPLSESIKRGYVYVNESNTALDQYVGNQLSCTSCHAGAGTGEASSLVGVTAVSPEYNPRAAKVMSIEDRINGCMIRSMNGEKLPLDSTEMRDMVSYLTYISKGIPVGADIPWRKPNTMKVEDLPETDLASGEEIYNQSCVACHGADGNGIGANTGPAVWGENSFNDGAGMARLSTATMFIQRNMPVGQEGTLTLQEAADVAAYILSKDRPKFPGRANDWPKGGAPKDSPYYDELKSVQAGL